MKKIIYLQDENGNFQKYEYENISDLNEELKKRKITIGDRAKIGECAKIGADAKIGARATIEAWAKIGAMATIGAGATIEARATIGEFATIGAGATIEAWAKIGKFAKIGAGATIGKFAKIGAGAKIGADANIGARATIGEYNSFFAVNLYKYTCGAWIEEKRGEIVQLGCFTRTRKEWEDDFWNNEKEFPNDNSDKSNARLRAFKMCCTFLDLIKNK